MCPNERIAFAQIGQLGLRTQGASMNWKPFKKIVSYCVKISFFFLMFDMLDGKTLEFGVYHLTRKAIFIITMALIVVAFQEMDRDGLSKIKLNLFVCNIILIIVTFILVFTHHILLWKIGGWNFADEYLLIPLYAFYAALFPLALYLNRNMNKSSSPPANADAE
jgi:hypothetical protein